MRPLDGRVALVTGGLRGIGRAIVDRFVAEGAYVMAGDLDDETGGLGENVIYHKLDVTQDGDWNRGLTALRRAFGKPSIIVNNAGGARGGNVANTSDEDWHFMMQTNAFSVFLGCRHAVAEMAQDGGVIINMASARGRRAGAGQCAYSASKAAVLSLTESVALYCGEVRLPIRCNAICPGVVETPMMQRHAASHGDSDHVRVMAGMQLLGRLGQPSEIAAAALFLASDEGSFLTGAVLDVDGGFRIAGHHA